MRGGEECGQRTDPGGDFRSGGGDVPKLMGADDHVDARGDHRGGMDERRDRGGAGHRVGQPDIERDLRALARGGQQQQ